MNRTPGGGGDRLELAMEVLELVAQHRTGISANDLASALDIPRSSMYRVLNTLVRQEFLVRRPDLTGFILGVRVVELARHVSGRRTGRHDVILARLRQDTAGAIHLVRFVGDRLELMDEDPLHPISDMRGFLASSERSAAGQLLLLERIEQGLSVPPSAGALADATRARGYAQQVGLLSADRACMAVPVHDGPRRVGAIAFADAPSAISAAARHVPRLRSAAEEVAALWVEHAGPPARAPLE